MKKIIPLVCLMVSATVYAQPKLISQAIITTKTTIVSPEEDDNNMPPSPPPGGNGEEIRIMRFGGDGETTATTWLKNDMVKTYSESDMGRTTIIRDNSKKMTTTIMEMMGKKTGFYVSDSDQAIIAKRMDSMMRTRNADNNRPAFSGNQPVVDIAYVDETRKISGYACKKALLITTRPNGKKDSSIIWYAPDIKLQGLNSTGGNFAGFGGFSPQAAAFGGMDKLNGFPMQYERTMNRGRKMTVLVTKLVTDKEVTDKEFNIPRDIELRSMKDMQNGGQGGFQMRFGG